MSQLKHTLLELGNLSIGGLRELNVGDSSAGDSSHNGEQTGNSSVLHCVCVSLGVLNGFSKQKE